MAKQRPNPAKLVPQVVQTSEMDCGPASLKAILEGYGLPISYGRLREACQTQVDGTSVDTLEEVAVQLGMDAEQVMVPADHLLLDEAELLPALVVVQLPSGITHFVVAWNQVGPWVQVMDPATGRQWRKPASFLRDLFIHTFEVPSSDWTDWATSEDFLRPLRALIQDLGVSREKTSHLIDIAVEPNRWRPLAALDAATRMVGALTRSGGLRRGKEASAVLTSAFERQLEDESSQEIPPTFWSVTRASEDDDTLNLRGALLIRFRGFRRVDERKEGQTGPAELPPELKAALAEPPRPPFRDLWSIVRRDGLLPPATIAAGAMVAALTVMAETLVFRGLLDLRFFFGLAEQRLGAVVAVIALLFFALLLTLPERATAFRLGRNLEIRLRMAFLAKIPRLADRYFRSRLSADMAERAHAIHTVRTLPAAIASLYRSIAFMVATVAAIIWLDPSNAIVAVAVVAASVGLPLVSQRLLVEKDLKVRTQSGALTRFLLDALLGLTALRCHSAEQAIRREHESMLVEWARSSMALLKSAVWLQGAVTLSGFLAAAWLLVDHLSRAGQTGMVLLLIYWVLSLPALGQEIAITARTLPTLRNTTLRLIEPLGAPDETTEPETTPNEGAPDFQSAVDISLAGVSVVSGGNPILDDVDLEIPAGSHVAIVGSSGAGKSSLVGLLLGWHKPARGEVRVGGAVLAGPVLQNLRRHTAWVDPEVQIWNRSLIENLHYGSEDRVQQPPARTLKQANLYDVVERLPQGLKTDLGEGGGLLSGGEGQRVRLGRAVNRPDVRLAILDEPFRGLDRDQRRALLEESRQRFSDATLLFVTHDLRETLIFDRVIVLADGHIVEDGPTQQLEANPSSRYRQLLDAEEDLRTSLWMNPEWRRLNVDNGQVEEEPPGELP